MLTLIESMLYYKRYSGRQLNIALVKGKALGSMDASILSWELKRGAIS